MNSLHPEDIEERRQAFDRAWRNRFVGPVSRMPANVQGEIHDMLKSAFKAGATFERRKHEPSQLGGID